MSYIYVHVYKLSRDWTIIARPINRFLIDSCFIFAQLSSNPKPNPTKSGAELILVPEGLPEKYFWATKHYQR